LFISKSPPNAGVVSSTTLIRYPASFKKEPTFVGTLEPAEPPVEPYITFGSVNKPKSVGAS
jgi:hypothetical protein